MVTSMISLNERLGLSKTYYRSMKTQDYSFRIHHLNRLECYLKAHEMQMNQALYLDLRKSAEESYLSELGLVYQEIRFMRKHLKRWMKPKRVRTGMVQWPSQGWIYQEPLGVVLIISPWNYPLQLSLVPLIGALASGNCCILKTSEHAPATAAFLTQLVNDLFDPDFISVVEGDAQVSHILTTLPFDAIFFTGSTAVGKQVLATAATNLVPVTLELGGKSPAVVAGDADINLAAKRIIWGKCLNSGQTCVAPDMVYVDERVYDAFISACIRWIKVFYGDTPLTHPDWGRIINTSHYQRLVNYLNQGTICYGGGFCESTLQIEPTLMSHLEPGGSIWEDELFGPILPVVAFKDMNALIDELSMMPHPLALYLFTPSKSIESAVLKSLSFGGGCINDTIMHLTSDHLPFGGIGVSGMGAYHGQKSLETFSHSKSILKSSSGFDLPLRYPPYQKSMRWLKRFFR